MSQGTCSVEGCGRVEKLRRTLCDLHYYRMRVHGHLDVPVRPRPVMRLCSVDGCQRKHSARGHCSYHYYLTYNTQMVPAQCAVCDKPMMRQVDSKRASCSHDCFWFIQTERFPDARWSAVPSSHPSRRPEPEITGSSAVFFANCCICGQTFATRYSPRTSCSPACSRLRRVEQQREGRQRRRARQRQAYVARVVRLRIHERDRWRCHLCHRKVQPNAVVPHPRAPTLDHIVPLAMGGTHEPSNVATACFLCNSIKGSAGGNEQLLLIG